MNRWKVSGWMAAILVGGTMMTGCTAIKRDNALQTERTLAAAGFQMKFADDTGRLANAEQIQPQRTLVPQSLDGEPRFVYADAEFCKCVHVGTERAYQQYQKLSIQQQISNAQLSAAEAQESAAMNWGMWGGWGPWY